MWSRRIGRDGVRVGLGRGTLVLPPVVESGDSTRPDPSATQLAAVRRWSHVSDAVIPLVIAPAEAFAVAGAPHAVAALLRSFVVQIATTLGPADVQIVVVSDDAPAGNGCPGSRTRAAHRARCSSSVPMNSTVSRTSAPPPGRSTIGGSC